MPTKKFALEKGGPQRIELSWKGMWKNLSVKFDDREIGVIPDQKTLKQGQTFSMGDGSNLFVHLAQSFGSAQLEVLRDGKPLPGSDADPEQQVNTAAGILFFIGGLNVVIGILAEFAQVEFLQQLGIGIFSVIFGVVYLVLGVFTRQRSRIALGIAIALYVLDGLFAIMTIFQANGTPGMGGLVVRVLFLIPLIQGFNAMSQIES